MQHFDYLWLQQKGMSEAQILKAHPAPVCCDGSPVCLLPPPCASRLSPALPLASQRLAD